MISISIERVVIIRTILDAGYSMLDKKQNNIHPVSRI